MLKTITNLSTQNAKSQVKDVKTNPELLLALRRQRLEARLEAIEPCLFKYTTLLTREYYNIDKDAENPSTSISAPNNIPSVPVSITLKA